MKPRHLVVRAARFSKTQTQLIRSMRKISMNIRNALRQCRTLFSFGCAAVVVAVAVSGAQAQTPPTTCERTVKADVVALDQALIYNRLGAINPAGMIYALKRDVVAIDPSKGLVAGNVQLRPGKRPRPIALRMNVGDCLQDRKSTRLNSSHSQISYAV